MATWNYKNNRSQNIDNLTQSTFSIFARNCLLSLNFIYLNPFLMCQLVCIYVMRKQKVWVNFGTLRDLQQNNGIGNFKESYGLNS